MSLATKLKAGEARARLKQVQTRTVELQKQLGTELQAARSFQDKNLSGEGLGAKRRELEQAARAKLQTELAKIRQEAEQDLATMRAFAEEDRPKSAASELKQQRLWDRTRQLLDSGRTLREVIAQTDDVDTLLAIREEAPTWMQARAQVVPGSMGQWTEPDVAGLLRSIDLRLADTAEGLAGLAASWGLEATALEAGLQPTLGYLEQEATGTAWQGQGLVAAIAARFAEQEAQRGLLDEPASDGGAAA